MGNSEVYTCQLCYRDAGAMCLMVTHRSTGQLINTAYTQRLNKANTAQQTTGRQAN